MTRKIDQAEAIHRVLAKADAGDPDFPLHDSARKWFESVAATLGGERPQPDLMGGVRVARPITTRIAGERTRS